MAEFIFKSYFDELKKLPGYNDLPEFDFNGPKA
jgi:hypothetical protein